MNNIEFLPNVKEDYDAALQRNKDTGFPDLTPQMKVFGIEYSIAGNFSAACRKVGISRDRGARLLRDRIMQAYIEDLLKDAAEETIITRDFLELRMLETLDQVNGDVEVPCVTRDGEVVMARNFNANAKIALMKEMKAFSGVRTAGNNTGTTINIDLSAFGLSRDSEEKEVVGVTIENGSD